MKKAYDLLIKWNNGESRIIHNVIGYRVFEDGKMFEFVKDGFGTFIPSENVMYIGRLCDYEDGEVLKC